MAKQRRPRQVKPDEVIENNAFAIGRFGKDMIWKSKLNKESHEELQKKLIADYPKVVNEIDGMVASIAALVSQLPAEQLLHRAWWEAASKHIRLKAEADIGFEESTSIRMIDYVQSVIASVQPASNRKKEVSEEDWVELRSQVEKLFSTLNLPYHLCRTAKAKAEDPKYNVDIEDFFYKAQVYWCSVRGARYQVHEKSYLEDVFTPHSSVLKDLFGLNADKFIDELMKIWDALTFGVRQVFEEMESFRSDTLAAMEAKVAKGEGADTSKSPSELMQQVILENGWEERQRNVLGRFLGLDLYDVEKLTSLPKHLLDELSWGEGQDTDFFADGEFKGWPLRIWPIFKRPFLRLGGRYYCFDMYSLFDNIYRVMQRIIFRLKPDYKQTWNQTQQALTEELPFKYLEAILPGSKVYRPVYYQWFVSAGQSSKDWCETDGLLVYDDHLFVIECKGGAFTYTPPATDFPAFLASLKNLVLSPAVQGKRFLDYLGSADSVALYDKNHQQIGEIRKGDFRHVSICPVTLDPFTEMAAQVQHLRKIGVDVGAHPIWAVSIDDLRVYADIFDSPLSFLHYVEQRNEAFKSDVIQSDDELDHLGLYLEHNHYSSYAAEKKGSEMSHLSFLGYRSNIDKFFFERTLDPSFPCPLKQEAPSKYVEIIDWLATSARAGRSKLASYLLDLAEDERQRVADCIDSELKRQPTTGKPKAWSTYGGDMVGYTIFCYSDGIVAPNHDLALSHAKQAMLLGKERERLLLELTYAESGVLRDVNWSWLVETSIPPSEQSSLRASVDKLRQQRLAAAKKVHRKIGRNQQCPCGSGKKYKRCCLDA